MVRGVLMDDGSLADRDSAKEVESLSQSPLLLYLVGNAEVRDR